MKKGLLILSLMMICLTSITFANEEIKGEIVEENGNLTVVKVWGDHYERGYAYGYLMAEGIKELYEDYLTPMFGAYLPMIKSGIVTGQILDIKPAYYKEAQGVYQGMVAAGFPIQGGDYADILLANTLLDVIGIAANMGCSSLLSWDEATAGTEDAGKAIITRHLDWDTNPALIENQVLVVHIPNEKNEQPWAMVGFAGMMSSLSGINSKGIAAFQHVMGDFEEEWDIASSYIPIWFALRSALETYDYNSDGKHNTNDVRAALDASKNGFADSYIISALASANQEADSLTAMIAEIAPNGPTHVYRNVNYDDDIPGDNIYTANSQIARNDSRNYCNRYNAVKANFGDGTGNNRTTAWEKMKSYSNAGAGNIQMMQFSPEDMILRLAVHENGKPAYQNEPYEFDLATLFNGTSSVEDEITYQSKSVIYPNPAKEFINLNLRGIPEITIYDEVGNLILEGLSTRIDISNLNCGVYVALIKDGKNTKREIFVKM